MLLLLLRHRVDRTCGISHDAFYKNLIPLEHLFVRVFFFIPGSFLRYVASTVLRYV